MPTTFSTAPYYDDFDIKKNFYRILVRPGRAIQARELTQMQTILGSQIEKFGDHIFKFGAMVKPGQIAYDLSLSYVKVGPTTNNVLNLASIDPENLDNANLGDIFIEGERTGVKAKVIKVVYQESGDPATIFVKYVNKGTAGVWSTFDPGDVNAIPTPIVAENIKITGTANPIAKVLDSDQNPLGFGSSVNIQDGVYYVNGIFADVFEQTLILDKYSRRPSYKVGLNIVEKIVTASDDASLNDNAQGYPNYAAPGADRYSIELILVKRAINSDTDNNKNFVELFRIVDGVRQKHVEETAYGLLEDTFARRTYDESGDYYLKPFGIEIREHLNDGRNRGIYPAVAPPDDPTAKVGDETKLAVAIEPSKAYVKGYEIQTIATTYVDVDKARDVDYINNAAIRANLGNWVYVWNPYNIPSINQYQKINLLNKAVLYDSDGQISNSTTLQDSSNVIGTARVRNFEYYLGTINQQNLNPSAIYKMSLFDIQMKNGYSFSDVKTYYYLTDSGNDPIAGTICPEYYLIGPPTGAFGVGDHITSKDGLRSETIVHFDSLLGSLITRPRIASGSVFYPRPNLNEFIDYYIGSTLDTANAAKIKEIVYLHDSGNNSLIFRLPKNSVKSVKGENNQVDTSYVVRRELPPTTIQSGSLIININANETFDAFNVNEYVLTITEDNPTIRGRIVDLSATNVTISGNSLTISDRAPSTALATYNGRQVKLVAPIIKLISYPNAKDLQSKDEVISVVTIDGSPNYLSEVDVYSVTSITDSLNIDITNRFDWDGGQRDTHYKRGSITYKQGYPAPSTPIKVTYSYFRHGSGKDYFSVDSYNLAQLNYGQIPIYVSSDTGEVYALSDCLDFRPRTNFTDDDFPIGQTEILAPNTSIRVDMQYYMGRIDKVYLDKRGIFRVLRGIPSERPQAPEDPKDGMVLFVLTIPPYTYSVRDVAIERIDNRRYTMRDIGLIDRRVRKLEYYTTLTMLEKATADMSIPDDSTGLDRYKNGFICDSFVGHGIGDVSNVNYACAIDPDAGVMRPEFTQNFVDLNFIETDPDAGTVSSNFQKTGDFITLPYVEKPLIVQPYASKRVNINPYNVFNWVGLIELDPATDVWKDTTRKPDIITNDNSLYDAAVAKNNSGTVWSDWTTQWTGKPQVTTTETTSTVTTSGGGQHRLTLGPASIPDTPEGRLGNPIAFNADGSPAAGWARDGRGFVRAILHDDIIAGTSGGGSTTTTTRIINRTTTTESGQVRTGFTTTVVPGAVKQTVDDRLINADLIPFMRTRDIYFQGKRFKPSTVLYAFFDDIDVNKYCSGASGSGFTSIPPTVTFSGGGGSGATATAIIKNGEVIFIDITSGGSGYTSAPNISFGSISSGATAPDVSKINVVVENGSVVSANIEIKTDKNGSVNGMFRVPNNDFVRFHTGLRMFRLCDDALNRTVSITTFGEAKYQAQGLLETRQSTIVSTREPEFVRTSTQEKRILTGSTTTSETIVNSTNDPGEDLPPVIVIDPLAETFLTTQNGGNFLTSVDIFFATKDPDIPVTLQIRNTVNGYPGQLILPFGEVVLNPDQIIVDPDGTRNLATRFTFKSPVYILDNIEYSIVLMSNSDNYYVWVARVGEDQVGTTNPISAQPYTGSLFKSQNASTWSAEQMEDLKFTINAAEFNTSVVGNVNFVNDIVPSDLLGSLCFYTVSGSNKIRVIHNKHGMPQSLTPSSSKVYISGVEGTVNGITAALINGTHEISDVTLDSYTITIPEGAPGQVNVATGTGFNDIATGYSGNANVYATKNYQMDACHPIFQSLALPGTAIDYRMKTVTGKSVNGNQVAYQKNPGWVSFIPNTDFNFPVPMLIASPLNEVELIQNGIGSYANKSFTANALLSSTKSNLSPVLDTRRTGLIVIGNNIANYSHLTSNVEDATTDYSDLRPSSKDVALTGCIVSSADNSLTAPTDLFNDITMIGKYVLLTNTGTVIDGLADTFSKAIRINDIPNPRKIVFDSPFDFPDITISSGTAKMKVYTFFIDEVSPYVTSSPSKYITRPLQLTDPANALRIFVTAFKNLECDFDLYYRVGRSSDVRLFTDVPYKLLPLADIPKNNLGIFVEYNYSAEGLEPFDIVAFKIVPRSTNTAIVPIFKDFRGIALST